MTFRSPRFACCQTSAPLNLTHDNSAHSDNTISVAPGSRRAVAVLEAGLMPRDLDLEDWESAFPVSDDLGDGTDL